MYRRKYKRYSSGNDHITHIDSDWVYNKMKKRSGAFYHSDRDSLAQIDYIWQVSKIIIFYYNIILWLKYVRRNIKKICRGEFYE